MLEFKELKALGQVAGHKIHKWRATALTHAKKPVKGYSGKETLTYDTNKEDNASTSEFTQNGKHL